MKSNEHYLFLWGDELLDCRFMYIYCGVYIVCTLYRPTLSYMVMLYAFVFLSTASLDIS